jgi:hypothetical protein
MIDEVDGMGWMEKMMRDGCDKGDGCEMKEHDTLGTYTFLKID